jgi:hypothetical protein
VCRLYGASGKEITSIGAIAMRDESLGRDVIAYSLHVGTISLKFGFLE